MRTWRSSRQQRRLGALTVVFWLGCGSPPPPSYTEVQALMNTSCTFSSCHGTGRAGGLSLVASDSYCALVGTRDGATSLLTAKDPFPRRIIPGSRSQSFLYRKLTLSAADSGTGKPLGQGMPPNQPLDEKSLDLFGRWIDSGALNTAGIAAPGGCP
ncbi:MAG: hypothetical protein JNJ46_19850 [Myxococcales bacterium]|nr:hypothetical protein [Myxococcales bacterium]